MVGFIQKMGIKSTFKSALKAAQKNSLPTQLAIGLVVQARMRAISDLVDGKTASASTELLRKELAQASSQRQSLNAAGNHSESNPEYARVALVESALLAVCSGDEMLANTVVGELNAWLAELGL